MEGSSIGPRCSSPQQQMDDIIATLALPVVQGRGNVQSPGSGMGQEGGGGIHTTGRVITYPISQYKYFRDF